MCTRQRRGTSTPGAKSTRGGIGLLAAGSGQEWTVSPLHAAKLSLSLCVQLVPAAVFASLLTDWRFCLATHRPR